MDLNDLGAQLFGKTRLEGAAKLSTTHTITGVAQEDSSSGRVRVIISDDVTSSEDGDGTSQTLEQMTGDTTVELDTEVAVKAGDVVTITTVGGELKTPTVTGVVGGGDRMQSAIDDASDDASAAVTAAEEAKMIAEATEQHFWEDSNGIHVTEVSQDDWNDPTSPDYHAGANQLSNAQGILIRDGELNIAAFSQSAVSFFDGTGNDAGNVVASFGASGAQIGATDETHVSMDSDSFELIDNGVEIVHFGYGEGADSGGSMTMGPHFTLGVRSAAYNEYNSSRTYDIGARVIYNGDSYICKVAVTTPEAWDSSKWIPLVGNYSLLAGNGGAAAGEGSLASGQGVALGWNSAALGLGTTVTAIGSVAVGKYNVEDTASDKLFIVGNGSNNVARSDALTVDMYGNVAAESFNLWHGQRNLSSADNIDQLYESGIYYLPGSVPGGTYPSGANGQYASLLSMGNNAEDSSTGWVGRQILVQGAGGVWHRTYAGSPRAWTDWKPLDESSHPTEIPASSLTLTGCSLNGASTIPAYKIGRHVTINMRVNITAANPTIAGFPATSGANSHIPVIAYRQSDNAAIAGYMTNAGVVTFPALASGSNIMFHVDYIANS